MRELLWALAALVVMIVFISLVFGLQIALWSGMFMAIATYCLPILNIEWALGWREAIILGCFFQGGIALTIAVIKMVRNGVK